MEYGIYTSSNLEVAKTKYWALVIYCNDDKTVFGSKLYNGSEDNKTLAAICERNNNEQTTKYAFEIPNGQKFTNDFDGVCKLLGSNYECDITTLNKKEDLHLTSQYEMPTVSQAGIKECLRLWRKGVNYHAKPDLMQFQLITDNIEYIFSIDVNNTNIYCGASINLPFEYGMFGKGQYYRLRNYADNSQAFCRFYCNIGEMLGSTEVPVLVCESGQCKTTSDGLYWPLKRNTEDEIVLDGCGGDEYIYKRNAWKSEYFTS
jgi:hypothetical protein